MSVEKRGPSFRAKVWVGTKMVSQETFATRAEAVAYEKHEKARHTLALPAKSLDDFLRLQSANSAKALREFDLRREGFIHVSELPTPEHSLPRNELTLGELATRYLREATPKKKAPNKKPAKSRRSCCRTRSPKSDSPI